MSRRGGMRFSKLSETRFTWVGKGVLLLAMYRLCTCMNVML